MKINKVLSIFLSLIMLVASVSVASLAYAKTTTEDDVVIVEDTSSSTNRYIYYPEELTSNSKKYPLIVWANGTGCRQSLYKELIKGFAKEGFIVVSGDETMAADGKDQISNLDYILKKAKSASNDLYNRIYTNKITAMGHSQGGRSAVNAASADSRFNCVVSIAGSNYQNEAELLRAPAFFLTGTNDGMVDSAKWVKPAFDACQGAAAYASLIGAKHTACCNEPEKYIPYCVSWIKAWTDSDFKALSVFKSGGALSKDSAWTDVTRKNLTNNISGSVTLSSSLYFTIVPKPTSIKKLTAEKGGFKASWKKLTTQTTGYQLQYSTSSNFKNAKTVTVDKNTTTTKAVSALSKGKKYYVRVRTYKTVGKTKYYSAWSGAKNITTKK